MTNHVKCCYRSSKVKIGNWPQDLLTYLYFFFFFFWPWDLARWQLLVTLTSAVLQERWGNSWRCLEKNEEKNGSQAIFQGVLLQTS